MSEVKISVLTPTYNRANYLVKLYESLCRQNYSNFEWIVIDDGSDDDTSKVVKNLSDLSNFEIKYVFKENGGKPSAHNEGIRHANSELVLICDDDDYLVDDALVLINKFWNKYSDEKVGGMIGYRGSTPQTPINHFTSNNIIGNIQSLFKDGLFDTTQIYRTSILKEKLFPITKNEKFVPEVWLWNEIDKESQLIVIHKVLEICEYLPGGLTKTGSQNIWNNPVGYSYYFYQKAGNSGFLNKIKYYGLINGLLYKKDYIKDDFRMNLFYKIISFPIACITKFVYFFKRGKKYV